MYTIDEQLTNTMRSYLMTAFSVLSTIVVISCVTPVFALCLVPMCLFYISEQKFFTVRCEILRVCVTVNIKRETYDAVSESKNLAYNLTPCYFE